ncbi:MAG: hypothetical protein MUE40_03920 [Anaerolineae bacterium]|jgi:hypothetical protein|nr:hypothetical protein [Anaerolineae bacterium]
MAFLTDKQGNLSFVRVSILVAVIGAVFLGGSLLTFVVDQQSRRAPFFIDLPPGAQQWGLPVTSSQRPGWQQVFYRVAGADPASIAAFYQQKMVAHYGAAPGQSSENCTRLPDATRQFTSDPADTANIYDASYEPGVDMPYLWRCLFDRGGLGATQWTQVTIHPGLRNADPALNTEGSVVIIYEQRWQAQ